MPNPSGFDPNAEVIYLGAAAFYIATGKRYPRNRVRQLLSRIKNRVMVEETKEIRWRHETHGGHSPVGEKPKRWQTPRYSQWWTAVEHAASELVELAQQGKIVITGDRDERREELSAGFLGTRLYADPSNETVRPELLEEWDGEFGTDGPIYRAISFRFSEIRGVRAQQSSAVNEESPRAPTSKLRLGRPPDYEMLRRFMSAACHILYNDHKINITGEVDLRRKIVDRMAELGWETPSDATARKMSRALWGEMNRSVE